MGITRQIEAARRIITRYTKRGAKLCIRIFPDKSVTARTAESRMYTFLENLYPELNSNCWKYQFIIIK